MRLLRLGLPAFCSATALALCAVVAAPGCTDDAGGDTTTEAGSVEAGTPVTPTACTSCVAQACVGPWALCLTDARCAALRGCDNPFGESGAGRQQCFCAGAGASTEAGDASDEDPLALYAVFASCNDARTCTTCTNDCTAGCTNGGRKTVAGACGEAGASDGGLTDASDAALADGGDAGDGGEAGAEAGSPAPAAPTVETCASCVSSRCGDATKACALGTECGAFLGCAYGCLDASCAAACEVSHATGKASATELSSCTLTSCRSACGL